MTSPAHRPGASSSASALGNPAVSGAAPGDTAPGDTAPGEAGPATGSARDLGDSPASRRRGLPGGRVVTVATLIVIGVAVAEALLAERVGIWTTSTLLAAAIICPLITRHGDRSLPAMMPPLAFLTAVLVAGQWLLPQGDNSLRTREAVMIIQTLGPNALWVIGATALSVTIAAIAHVVDRRAERREELRATVGA